MTNEAHFLLVHKQIVSFIPLFHLYHLTRSNFTCCNTDYWGRYQSVSLCPFPGPKDLLSDRCILSCPSMDLVTCLLDFRLNFASNRSIVPRLAASLAACAQLSALGTPKPLHTRFVVSTILSPKNWQKKIAGIFFFFFFDVYSFDIFVWFAFKY